MLTITGCRIQEILNIRLNVISSLIEDNSVKIDRLKGNKKNQKVFINREGKKLFRARLNDIVLILASNGIIIENIKDRKFITQDLINRYFFQGRKLNEPLSRETFTNNFNTLLSNVPEFKIKNLKIRSHSFRAGYIHDLWSKSGDIEYVRQVIGHTCITSTIAYTRDLTEEQKLKKFNELENKTNEEINS